MKELFDFNWYAPRALKIRTKTEGLLPFKLRKYQLKYLHHLETFDEGIIRSIVLKPRQAGFSTVVAGYNVHAMATREYEVGIMLADKLARTNEVHGIYSTMVTHLPAELMPMLAVNNSEEILFDNPSKDDRKKRPGLGSGFKSETAQDPNAGRSGTRKWAHMTEYAFYPYAESVDEGVQNSIPLESGTRIIKESTAFGMAGTGESFYMQWQAAERGDTIYRPFFVAWYEVDDYQRKVPQGFILTKEEIDLIRRCPAITNANLVWRRLKIREYSSSANSIFTPEERFKQDFPSYPEEAFLSTGRPIFDQDKLKDLINKLRASPPPSPRIEIKREWLAKYKDCLTVFRIPEKNKRYSIGADVAEGLEVGDSSSAAVIDQEGNECAVFHGKLDPDQYGNVLVDLGFVYNTAILVPEMNNMGHTTLEAIKKRSYPAIYSRTVIDEIDKHKETVKLGWRTTGESKQRMLSALVAAFRDDEGYFFDINGLREMMSLSRESDGNAELGGKDRIVAKCLARMGLTQLYEAATVTIPGKKEKIHFETKDRFRELKLGK